MGAAGRAARGGAQHLPADAAARPQHRRATRRTRRSVTYGVRAGGDGDRHRHLPHLRRAQQRRLDAARDRRGPRNRYGDRRSRDELHRRPVRSRTKTCTRWTTTSSWPSRSSTRARTCWRSRTWPGCCAHRPPISWSPRCAAGSTCRCTCTPTTPLAASWPPTWRHGRPAPTPSTVRRRRWRAPPASRRLSSIVAAAAHTEYDTGLSLSAVCDLEPYWEALRKVYAPFESGIPGPTGRVYRHEIPGGQLSNLRQQAIALGLGDRFEEIEANYAAADRMLGRLVKVTPSSKVVGDLALALVGAGVSADEFAADPARFDIPDSVIGFLRGELGDPPGGWPEPLRTKALAGRPPAKPPAGPDRRGRDRADAGRPETPGHAESAAVPWSHKGIRGSSGTVRRHLAAVGQPVLLRAAPRRRTPGQAGTRRRAADRAGGDLRSRRTRHAHRDVHPQRTTATGGGA